MKARAIMRNAAKTAATAYGAAAFALSGGCAKPTTAPEPPAGGQRYVLDYAVFVASIDTIFTARGCDDANCHGGGIRGTFELSPVGGKDVDMDYFQVSLQVDPSDPTASPILRKPLDEAAGGAVHAAQPPAFATTGDPDYQAILNWIESGEYR